MNLGLPQEGGEKTGTSVQGLHSKNKSIGHG